MVEIGRTYLEDAEDGTPLTLAQKWSGYASALDDAIAEVDHAAVAGHPEPVVATLLSGANYLGAGAHPFANRSR